MVRGVTGSGAEGHGTMIAVLIATDTRIYRDGLVLALRDHPIVTVAGMAASAVEALDGIRTLNPGVVLLDTGMAGAVDVAHFARGHPSEPKVVALSVIDVDAEKVTKSVAVGEFPWGVAVKD